MESWNQVWLNALMTSIWSLVISHAVWLIRMRSREIFCIPTRLSWYVGKLNRKVLWYSLEDICDTVRGSKLKPALMNKRDGSVQKRQHGWFRKLIMQVQGQNWDIISFFKHCPTLSWGWSSALLSRNGGTDEERFCFYHQRGPRQIKTGLPSEYQRKG